MEARPVSRCIAIAAHGKRCQQSPFRGSPYCWHHTQSRKVWPPSRPSSTSTRAAALEEAARRDAAEAAERLRDAELRTARRTAIREFVDELDVDDLAALAAFADGESDGTVVVTRSAGRVTVRVQPSLEEAGRATA